MFSLKKNNFIKILNLVFITSTFICIIYLIFSGANKKTFFIVDDDIDIQSILSNKEMVQINSADTLQGKTFYAIFLLNSDMCSICIDEVRAFSEMLYDPVYNQLFEQLLIINGDKVRKLIWLSRLINIKAKVFISEESKPIEKLKLVNDEKIERQLIIYNNIEKRIKLRIKLEKGKTIGKKTKYHLLKLIKQIMNN